MGNIDKIRAKIDRMLDDICDTDGFVQKKDEPRYDALAEVLDFLDALEEQPDKSLEEAAEELIDEALYKWFYDDEDGIEQYVHDAFIAGAEWQKEQDLAEMAQSKSPLSVAYANRCFENGKQAMKEQMLKDAVEGIAHPDDCEIWVNLVGYGYKFNDGDNVKLIVVKED